MLLAESKVTRNWFLFSGLPGIARVPELLELLRDDLGGGLLEAGTPWERPRVVRPVDPADLAHDVAEPALRRDHEDRVELRQGQEVDAAILRCWFSAAEPPPNRSPPPARFSTARLSRVVATGPGNEHAQKERGQEIGDDVAVLILDRHDFQSRDGCLVNLFQAFDQVEDELQVRGVGRPG